MSSSIDRPQLYGRTIKQKNSYHADNNYTYFPVVIIGAGASGIAMGCRLKEVLGCDQFRIFERHSGIGGTWWINRYPGVACDVPSPFYSFSFCPNPNWTNLNAEGPEILKYLQDVCEKYQILDKIQVNTDINGCRWLESEGVWEVTLRHLVPGVGDLSLYDRAQKVKEQGIQSVYIYEEVVRAKVVISAVGAFLEPHVLPESIAGKNKFQGEIFHSARWRSDVVLKDKNVIVVGTGCSAAQLVPELRRQYGAKSVTQLMRSPPWVTPRPLPESVATRWDEWAPWLSNNIPGFIKLTRAFLWMTLEYDWRLFGSGAYQDKQRKSVEISLLKHMRTKVPEKYHDILRPSYTVGCKRRVLDLTWFSSLNDPAIQLIARPLVSIAEDTVTLGSYDTQSDPDDNTGFSTSTETTLPADVIILANGFQVTEWFHSINVIGRHGKSLNDVFSERGGPQMYMGAAMDGFPNFFTIFGPNTATGHTSVIYASECMVNMSLKFIKPILKGDVDLVEVKKEAEVKYSRDIQNAVKRSVWNTGGCISWYKTKDNWNSTCYPYSQFWFTLYTMFPTWSDWNIAYTRKGALKKRTNMLLKSAVLLATLSGAVGLVRGTWSLKTANVLLRGYAKEALLGGVGAVQKIGERL